MTDLQPHSNGPDILQLQRSLLPNQLALVPGRLARCNISRWFHDGLPTVVDDRLTLRHRRWWLSDPHLSVSRPLPGRHEQLPAGTEGAVAGRLECVAAGKEEARVAWFYQPAELPRMCRKLWSEWMAERRQGRVRDAEQCKIDRSAYHLATKRWVSQ
jgi:hypothetical protein